MGWLGSFCFGGSEECLVGKPLSEYTVFYINSSGCFPFFGAILFSPSSWLTTELKSVSLTN